MHKGKVPSLKLVPRSLESHHGGGNSHSLKSTWRSWTRTERCDNASYRHLQKQWSTPSRPRESACLEDTICGMVGCPGTPLTIVGDVVADLPQADKGAPGTGYPCPLHQIVHETGEICDYFDAWGKRIRHRDLRSDIEAGRKAARQAVQQMNPPPVEATVCMVETAGIMPAAQPAVSIAPSTTVQATSTQAQTEPPPTTNHWGLETDQRVWRRTPEWCTSAQLTYGTVQQPPREAPVMAPTLQFTAQPDARTLQPPVGRIPAIQDDQQTPVGRPMSSRDSSREIQTSEQSWEMEYLGEGLEDASIRWEEDAEVCIRTVGGQMEESGRREGSAGTRCSLGNDGIHHQSSPGEVASETGSTIERNRGPRRSHR